MTEPDVGHPAPGEPIPDAAGPVGRIRLHTEMSVTEAIQGAGSRLAAALQLCEGIERETLPKEMVRAIRGHLVEAGALLSQAEVPSYPPRPDPAAPAAGHRPPGPHRSGPDPSLLPGPAAGTAPPAAAVSPSPLRDDATPGGARLAAPPPGARLGGGDSSALAHLVAVDLPHTGRQEHSGSRSAVADRTGLPPGTLPAPLHLGPGAAVDRVER